MITAELDRKIEAVIAGLDLVGEILGTHTEMLKIIGKNQEDLSEWIKEPPKSDLPDLLKQIISSQEALHKKIDKLLDGELPGRG